MAKPVLPPNPLFSSLGVHSNSTASTRPALHQLARKAYVLHQHSVILGRKEKKRDTDLPLPTLTQPARSYPLVGLGWVTVWLLAALGRRHFATASLSGDLLILETFGRPFDSSCTWCFCRVPLNPPSQKNADFSVLQLPRRVSCRSSCYVLRSEFERRIALMKKKRTLEWHPLL